MLDTQRVKHLLYTIRINYKILLLHSRNIVNSKNKKTII